MASKVLYDATEQEVPDKPRRKKAPFLITIVLRSLSLLWVAPVVAVLVLNFYGWIIGASLACGIRGCSMGYGDPNCSGTVIWTRKFKPPFSWWPRQ